MLCLPVSRCRCAAPLYPLSLIVFAEGPCVFDFLRGNDGEDAVISASRFHGLKYEYLMPTRNTTKKRPCNRTAFA